jgi:hypothetical protein
LARSAAVLPSAWPVAAGLESVPAQLDSVAEVARNSDVVLIAVVNADRAGALADKDLDAAVDLGMALEVPTPPAIATKPLIRDVYTGHR